MRRGMGIPEDQGLYVSEFEKDNCGIGLVASIKGEKTHDIVRKGIRVLEKLEHRGAVGSDPNTGDGAGMLMQIPDEMFRDEMKKLGIVLPAAGEYGVGMIFLPKKSDEELICEGIVEDIIKEEGQAVIGWRRVPVDPSKVGEIASSTMPVIKQVFIKKSENVANFELKLYIIRKRIESAVANSKIKNKENFYIPSMSSRVIVYKGLLLADQVSGFYTDFNNTKMKSAIALVHQRYSTNTFPSWDLAQPFRYLAHNGEINTVFYIFPITVL